jgi:serine/threonine-protein kinase
MSRPLEDDAIEWTVGRYTLYGEIAAGGMATVHIGRLAGDAGFSKLVAIKRMHPQFAKDEEFLAMFLDEARLAARIDHPNVVHTHEVGFDGEHFIAMEYVEGQSLEHIIRRSKQRAAGPDADLSALDAAASLPLNLHLFVLSKVLEALDYAHELKDPQGQELHIVHRDMSPPNVLVTKHGEVKIVDFGLAKANSQLEKSEPGIIKGKFSYLSPEAAMGQDVDLRTDIFAVGIILWELLAGQRLFMGESDFQTVKKVQQAVIPSIAQINRSVTPELEHIINRALARDPEQRYRSARDLSRELTNFLFTYGQPVGNFDVAQLVAVAMRDRQTHKKKPQGSIIDKLIEEALLEFTSLGDDAPGQPASSGGAKSNPDRSQAQAPLNLGDFAGPKGWLDDVRISQLPSAPASAPLPVSVQAGNLSALEDDAPPAHAASSPGPASSGAFSPASQSGPVPALQPGAYARPAGPTVASREASSSGGGGGAAVVIVIAVAVIAVGAIGAWVAGLIPH